MGYEYILEDNIEKPLRYQYTAYRGVELLRDWYASRQEVLEQIGADISETVFMKADLLNPVRWEPRQRIDMKETLCALSCALFEGKALPELLKDQLDGLVKSFEVRKRLYPFYSANFKPEDTTNYQDMTLYTAFSCVCAVAFERYQDLRYLNALLKVNDTLLSQWSRRNDLKEHPNRERMAWALQKELGFVKKICREKGLHGRSERNELI